MSDIEQGVRLAGKVALVTGGGSGIGLQTAARFAAEGARVAIADLRADAALQAAATLGAGALGIGLDVTSSTSADEAVAAVVDHFGDLDVVVNNAGVTIVGGVQEIGEDDWDRELATNLKGIYLMSRAAWPHLVARGGGVLLQTASIAGIWAIPDDAAYCASKAAAIMLTKCMALDGAKVGIRANCVCPGFTETPMIEGYFAAQPDPEAARAYATAMHPLGRLGQPNDLASAFVYLASDDAAWVTGTALVVDGGLTAGIWGG